MEGGSREADQLAEVEGGAGVGLGADDRAAVVDPVVLGAALDLDLSAGGRVDDILDAQGDVGAAAGD